MNALAYVARKYQLQNIYVGTDVIKSVKRAHPDINWRHHIHQTDKAQGFDEQSFDPEITKPMRYTEVSVFGTEILHSRISTASNLI